ncbi:hypothetical protein CSC75_18505, partial [Pseudoxanthomonas wuyuanensis]
MKTGEDLLLLLQQQQVPVACCAAPLGPLSACPQSPAKGGPSPRPEYCPRPSPLAPRTESRVPS